MTTPDAIHAADLRLQTIPKAHVVGATVQDPASRPAGEDTASAFTSAGALIPPYDPETLCLRVEHSNSLRQGRHPQRRGPPHQAQPDISTWV